MSLLTSLQSQLEQGQVPLIRKLLEDNAACIEKIRHQDAFIGKQAGLIEHMKLLLEDHSAKIQQFEQYIAEVEEKRRKEEEEAKKKRELGDSLILDDSDKREKVRKFVDEERKVREFKIAYRGSRDGFQAYNFH
jgi:hypothetical protein